MAKTTTTKPKTTAKTTKSSKRMVSKPVSKRASKPEVKPNPVAVSDVVVSQPELKKKELVDLVVVRSGIKKKDAKPVVEAMLAVLGETIASGRELNLQPFGKLRINRTADKENGNVIVCKLRQSKAAIEKSKLFLAPAPGTV